jgi:mRNA interferase MazF
MPPSPKLGQGDVVLVPFPFADLTGQKMRPAVVVSGNPQGFELIVAFITSVLTNRSPRGAEVELPQSDPEFRVKGLKVDSLIRLTSSLRYRAT